MPGCPLTDGKDPAMAEPLTETARPLAELLIKRGETIAVGESSSGGLISASLLAIPGASAYFLGGGVIYTLQSREGLAGISAETMEGLRSSSEPYALLLANTMRDRMGAVWGLGESGAAGPSGNRYGDPPGHTCIAVCGPVEMAMTLETGHNDREENMHRFAEAALNVMRKVLEEANSTP